MKASTPSPLRIILALLLPWIIFAVQWTFWSSIEPYAWLLFLPTVFLSAWLGGLVAGLIATLVSAGLVAWFFIPPEMTLTGKSPFSVVSILIFCCMGGLFSLVNWRLQRASRMAAETSEHWRDSEENLAITLDSIADGVMATDAEGRITRLNRVAEKLTGWQNADAIGQPISQVFRIVSQQTGEPRALPISSVMSDNIADGLANDSLLVARDGTRTPVADNYAPIRDRNGNITGTVLIFRDISQEQAARQALQDSATRLRTVLDAVMDGIVTINDHGAIEMVNPAAERIFGHAASVMTGQNVSMLMPEPHRSHHDEYLAHYTSTLEPHLIGQTIELEGLRKDQSRFPIELSITEMSLGDSLHFVGLIRDITARKEADNLFNRFFSLPLDMLCITDSNGCFKRVNPAFTSSLGWTPEELTGRRFIDFIHPDDQEHTRLGIEKMLAGNQYFSEFENRFRHKNGRWRILSWKSIPDEKGFMYATARDMTEYRELTRKLMTAKEQADLANRAKSSFLATMSHEIRTPLTGMLGMLELLSLTVLDRDQHETLDTAWESGRRLLRIVSDILDWSKIEEGKLKLDPRPTTIESLLKEVVNTYSRLASTRSLMLWQHTDPRLHSAYLVDSLRLSQILNNFVSNAIKFTSAGEIEVRAELLDELDSGDRIRFSVRDTGMGIPAEVQDQLFQRYRQESLDTERMYGGTGLGLAICKRLSEMMDGQIELHSDPGHGSTFSVVLTLPISGLPGEEPMVMQTDSRQRQVEPLFQDPSRAPMVLAVDDHPINRELLARQLKLLGLQAETADNGLTALNKWQTGHYDLVITDCHMPEMDGYELARKIRESETGHATPIPIIAWTANALAEEANRCHNAGMNDLLVKPCDMTQLKKAVSRWLNVPSGKDVPVDMQVLSSIIEDQAGQTRLLREFMQHIRADLIELDQSLETGNLASIASTAHRMKGSARMVGAGRLAETCEQIEKAGRANQPDGARAARIELDTALASLDTFIERNIE